MKKSSFDESYQRAMAAAGQSKAGTYRLYGGRQESVIVRLNSVGHLDYCDDWEQITSGPDPREPHKGDKRQFFTPGMGGALFANDSFFASAQKID